jgi:hypothetical protein
MSMLSLSFRFMLAPPIPAKGSLGRLIIMYGWKWSGNGWVNGTRKYFPSEISHLICFSFTLIFLLENVAIVE